MTVPLSTPLSGLTVTQSAPSDTNQLMLELTLSTAFPDSGLTFKAVGDTLNASGAPVWVTRIRRVAAPVAETVMVAVR